MRGFGMRLGIVVIVALAIGGAAWGGPAVIVQRGETMVEVDLGALDDRITGTVAYQGPVFDESDPNWKDASTYEGVPLAAVLALVGGLSEDDELFVISTDGFQKRLPFEVVSGGTPAGTVVLALSRDTDPEWEDEPMLVFLPEDGLFSNDDMLASIGPERAHYFGDRPSTTGMMVKNVAYLIVNYDGESLPPLPGTGAVPEAVPADAAATDPLLTVIRGGEERTYTRSEMEELETITAPGTFTTSSGTDYTAVYMGVPLSVFIGNAPADATVRVSAADGYSMNYAAGVLADRSEGIWILAYKENGEYLPFDPGYYRIVRVGEGDPRFTSSLSAKMVERIEVLGTYEPYVLRALGTVERTFSREELEAGIGCPCHTATVTVTSKGETRTYTGLPLWRLIAYIDDDVFPPVDRGIHYDDGDFNDALAETGYPIELVASDGYSQTVFSDWIARDDRFVIAFKVDGAFLDPTADGYMRFVYDDSVELPYGALPKSVKFLAEIWLDLE